MLLFFSSEESVALNFGSAKLDFANYSTTVTLHSNIGPIVFLYAFKGHFVFGTNEEFRDNINRIRMTYV